LSLNLHSIVRGAIQTVNADTQCAYLKSTGSTPNADGSKTPTYATPQTVYAQIQPPSGRDLQHMDFLNLQGITRVAFLYGDPQGISRVDARGGDLLQFPQYAGNPVDNWLIVIPDETWTVGSGDWSKVFLVLQTDRPS
jgi:hypothetical protein